MMAPEKKLRVLIADDEFWIRENLKKLVDWNSYGLELLPMAADGEEAIRLMERTPADIIITDINMPYLSGVDLMHKLVEKWPHATIIVLSGYSDFKYVHEALIAGAIDYMLKPVDQGRFVEVLEKAMGRVLSDSREREEKSRYLEKMRLALSAMADRNFSRWLHEAHNVETLNDSVSQMYEYERNFSNYRLVLFKIISEPKNRPDSNEIKSVIESYFKINKKIIIHDLYHISRFLLITDARKQQLRDLLLRIQRQLEEKHVYVKIIISGRYFSFMTLRQAYDEDCEALLKDICNSSPLLCFSTDMKGIEIRQRLHDDVRKELEFAMHREDRDRFEQILEMTGVFHCSEREWRVIELQNYINNVVMIIRRYIEKKGSLAQLMAVDNYLNSFLEIIDRLHFAELRALFGQLLDESFSNFSENEKKQGIQDIVLKIREFVDEHYNDQISLGALASQFNVADSYLSHMFKEVTGQNLMLYLASVRIQHAKALLKRQDISITEVAIMVGYDDYSYFSRVFRKLEGTSPRAYREGLI